MCVRVGVRVCVLVGVRVFARMCVRACVCVLRVCTLITLAWLCG